MSTNNKYFNIKRTQTPVLPVEAQSYISTNFNNLAEELFPYWLENTNYYKSNSDFTLYGDRNSISSGKRWAEVIGYLPVSTGTLTVKIYSFDSNDLLIRKDISIPSTKDKVLVQIDMKSIGLDSVRARFELSDSESICECQFTRESVSLFNGSIEVNVDNLNPGENEVLYFSVPFVEGTLWSINNLILVDSNDNQIQSEFEIKNYWAYEGSIKWVGVYSEIPANLTNVYVTTGTRDTLTKLVLVSEVNNEITINTGLSTWVLDNSASIIKVISGETVKGLYVIDQNDRLGQHEEISKIIEKQDSVTACIKVEGIYKTNTDIELARHITRFEFFYNQPIVKITHTLVITNDTNDIWFKEVGWELPINVGNNKVVNISTNNTDNDIFESLNLTSEVYVLQKYGRRMGIRPSTSDGTSINRWIPRVIGIDQFVISDGVTPIVGTAMGDWVSVNGDSSTFMIACKDLHLQAPKGFSINPNKINFKLFDSNSDSGTASYYSGDLDFRMASTSERWGLQPYITTTASDTLAIGLTVNGESNVSRISRVTGYTANGIGWSKTHEIIMSTDDDTRWVNNLRSAPYCYVDTQWLYTTKVIGDIWYKDTTNYPVVEEVIERVYDEIACNLPVHTDFPGMTAPSLQGGSPFVGFFDYFAGPSYVHPGRWRLTYSFTYDSWILYMRSGERMLKEISTKINRVYMDNYVAHWSDTNPNPAYDSNGTLYERKVKGLFINAFDLGVNNTGKSDFPLYWEYARTFQMTTTTDINRSIYDYYINNYRRGKDIVEEFREAMIAEWTYDYPDFRAIQVLRLLDQIYTFTWDNDIRILLEKTMFGNPRILDEQSEVLIPKERAYDSSIYKTPTDVDVFVNVGFTLGSERVYNVARTLGQYVIESQGIVGRFSGYTPNFIYKNSVALKDNIIPAVFEQMASFLTNELRSDNSAALGYSDLPKAFKGLPLYMNIASSSNGVTASWIEFQKNPGTDVRCLVYKEDSERLNILLQCPVSGTGSSLKQDIPYGLVGSAVYVQPQVDNIYSEIWSGHQLYQITEYSTKFDDQRSLVRVTIPKDSPPGVYEIGLNREGTYTIYADKRFVATSSAYYTTVSTHSVPMMIFAPNGFKGGVLRRTDEFLTTQTGVAKTKRIYLQVPKDHITNYNYATVSVTKNVLIYKPDNSLFSQTASVGSFGLTISGVYGLEFQLTDKTDDSGNITADFDTYFSLDKSFFEKLYFIDPPPPLIALRETQRGVTLGAPGTTILCDGIVRNLSVNGQLQLTIDPIVNRKAKVIFQGTGGIFYVEMLGSSGSPNRFNLVTSGIWASLSSYTGSNTEFSISVAIDQGEGYGDYGPAYSVFTPTPP
jgi:hypothetical protein